MTNVPNDLPDIEATPLDEAWRVYWLRIRDFEYEVELLSRHGKALGAFGEVAYAQNHEGVPLRWTPEDTDKDLATVRRLAGVVEDYIECVTKAHAQILEALAAVDAERINDPNPGCYA